MTPANTLKAMSMSDIITAYNALATANGKSPVTEFKSLSFARSEFANLEKLVETPTQEAPTTEAGTAPADGTVKHASGVAGAAKYNSTDKRGPNQGVGAFAKELLMEGKPNKEVLEAVLAKFPAAKTSGGCIAYYRTALQRDGKLAKGGGVIPQDPAAMEAAADKAIAEAQALKEKAATVRLQLEESAKAKVAADEVAAAAAQPAA